MALPPRATSLSTAKRSCVKLRVAKKITAAEKLVPEQMLAMMEWAAEHPQAWHKIGNLEAL